MAGWSRRFVLGLLPVLIGGAVWTGAAGSAEKAPAGGLAERRLYVDPSNPAIAQAEEWQTEGRAADATLILEIANQPTATWIGGDAPAAEAKVRDVTLKAAIAKQLPLLVAYNIPLRDCGNFSAGGATSPEEYRVAPGLLGRPRRSTGDHRRRARCRRAGSERLRARRSGRRALRVAPNRRRERSKLTETYGLAPSTPAMPGGSSRRRGTGRTASIGRCDER